MANLLSTGAEETIRALQKADLFDDDAAARLLNAAGALFVDNVREEMERTRFRLSAIAQRVRLKGTVRRDREDRPYVSVTIDGKNRRGERNATVAFALNYGRRKEFGEIEPSHFWWKAKQQTAAEIPDAYAEVAQQIYQERGLI